MTTMIQIVNVLSLLDQKYMFIIHFLINRPNEFEAKTRRAQI